MIELLLRPKRASDLLFFGKLGFEPLRSRDRGRMHDVNVTKRNFKIRIEEGLRDLEKKKNCVGLNNTLPKQNVLLLRQHCHTGQNEIVREQFMKT